MTLPNPKVATAFLNDYIFIRQHKWGTLGGWLATFISDGPEAKIGECKLLNRDFYNTEGTELAADLKTAEGWFKLFLKLGKSARTHSFLSATTHAIRTHYIKQIHVSQELKDAFAELVTNLRDETTLLEKKIAEMDESITTKMEARASKEEVDEIRRKLEEERKKLNENLLKLADVGDLKATCKAARAGLFGELKCPSLKDLSLPQKHSNLINENIPLFYHPDYDAIHFEIYCHHLNHNSVSYEEYQGENFLKDKPKEISSGSSMQKDATMPVQPNGESLFAKISTSFTSFTGLGGSKGTNVVVTSDITIKHH